MNESWKPDIEGPYFDGPHIPWQLVFVIGGVFFTMLLCSTEKWIEYEAKYRELLVERDYVMNEVIPAMDDRMEKIEQAMCAREKELQEEYEALDQQPPDWVIVPERRRKQHIAYHNQ